MSLWSKGVREADAPRHTRCLALFCAMTLAAGAGLANTLPKTFIRDGGFDSRGVFWRIGISRDGLITATGHRTWSFRAKRPFDYEQAGSAQEGDVAWTLENTGRAFRIDLRTGVFKERMVKRLEEIGSPRLIVRDGRLYFVESSGGKATISSFDPAANQVSTLATFPTPDGLSAFAVGPARVWAVIPGGHGTPQLVLRVVGAPRSGGGPFPGLTLQRPLGPDPTRADVHLADDNVGGLWVTDALSQTVHHIDANAKAASWSLAPMTPTDVAMANGVAVVRVVSSRLEGTDPNVHGYLPRTVLNVHLAAFGPSGRMAQIDLPRPLWYEDFFHDHTGALRILYLARVEFVGGSIRLTPTPTTKAR
jgi:hypothetical protein